MATLQILDNTDTSHNYKNKNVMGHENRGADSDTEKWYDKSIFSQDKDEAGDSENPSKPDAPVEPEVKVQASVYDGSDKLNGIAAKDLVTDPTVDMKGTDIIMGGTVAYAAAVNDSFPVEKTNYYVPVKLTGTDDDVVTFEPVLGGQKKDLVFGKTGDGPNTIAVVLAVSPKDEKDVLKRTFVVKSADGTKQATYTIDCSGMSFAPATSA